MIMATTNCKNSANIGFEEQIWAAADILRGNMDAAEYKHVVLGLIFLKYITLIMFILLSGNHCKESSSQIEQAISRTLLFSLLHAFIISDL